MSASESPLNKSEPTEHSGVALLRACLRAHEGSHIRPPNSLDPVYAVCRIAVSCRANYY